MMWIRTLSAPICDMYACPVVAVFVCRSARSSKLEAWADFDDERQVCAGRNVSRGCPSKAEQSKRCRVGVESTRTSVRRPLTIACPAEFYAVGLSKRILVNAVLPSVKPCRMPVLSKGHRHEQKINSRQFR